MLHTLELDEKVECMAEANGFLAVGTGGLECDGYLYNLQTGNISIMILMIMNIPLTISTLFTGKI